MRVLSNPKKEKWERDIQRRQKKEAIEAHAIFQARQIGRHGFGPIAKRKLCSIFELLLRSQFTMRHSVGLECQRSRDAVLKLAQHFGQSGPTTRYALVLQ